MKVEEIMNKRVITANKKENIYEITRKMKEYDIGFIPITEGGKIIGVLTDRDICVKLLASKDINNIESYINSHIISVSSKDDIKVALEKMKQNKVKRVIVENEKKVVGILSISDIIEHISDEEVGNTTKSIFQKEVPQKEQTAEIDSFYL